MIKTIMIDGKEVVFKATASVPRLYRMKFKRDILVDIQKLQKSMGKVSNKKQADLTIDDLTIFENVAYIMVKHGSPTTVPDELEIWLDDFETFSIYKILPEILELWGMNMETTAQSKKKLGRQLGK